MALLDGAVVFTTFPPSDDIDAWNYIIDKGIGARSTQRLGYMLCTG